MVASWPSTPGGACLCSCSCLGLGLHRTSPPPIRKQVFVDAPNLALGRAPWDVRENFTGPYHEWFTTEGADVGAVGLDGIGIGLDLGWVGSTHYCWVDRSEGWWRLGIRDAPIEVEYDTQCVHVPFICSVVNRVSDSLSSNNPTQPNPF